MMKTIIFDIDGTIANVEHLLPLWNTDRDQFFARVGEANPIDSIVKLLYGVFFGINDIKLVFYTARPEKIRALTERWLWSLPVFDIFEEKEFKDIFKVLMKSNDDTRTDEAIKLEMLGNAGLTPNKVLFIVEDRNSIVKKLRGKGYTVLQPRDGSY